ncbi:MAG TPA: hypothetical protein VMC10_19390 [Stellaceae bacterium]|nr:hypothetical protein [Stellaceae bacterium]
MTLRTRSDTVTFHRPFVLTSVDGVQPAGTYIVETDEELLPTLSRTAYRRLATWLRLPAPMPSVQSAPARTQVVAIDPTELQAALARDTTLGWGVAVAGRLEDLLGDIVMEQTLQSAGLTPLQFKGQLRALVERIDRSGPSQPALQTCPAI